MEQGLSKSWKDLEQHNRKSLNRQVSRNVDFEETASEGSKGSKEIIIGNWGKRILAMEWQKVWQNYHVQ